MPTIREAILKAADHIERYPDTYNFFLGGHPNTCSPSKGCALSWIGYYLEIPAIRGPEDKFVGTYARAVSVALTGSRNLAVFFEDVGAQVCLQKRAPALLRAYADKRFPAPAKPRAKIPAKIRAIFEMTVEQLANVDLTVGD